MPDYKEMLRKQGRSALGYPSTMPTGKPPRDYSDSPLKKGRLTLSEVEGNTGRVEWDEPMDSDEQTVAAENQELVRLAAEVNMCLERLNHALSSMPAGRGRDTAAHYLATTTLWIQQAFREAEKK